MTQKPNQSSDPTPATPSIDNPWDDLDVKPVALSNGHHVAGDLYTNKSSNATAGMGLAFAWVGHPLALPVFLAGMVAMVITSCMAKNEASAKQEAANKTAMVDMAVFKKGLAAAGLERTCLAIDQKHVPAQYYPDCLAIKKASSKAKEARK